MGRFLLISLSMLLLASTFAACGSNAKLIPVSDADALKADLDQISSDVADGNCEDATAGLSQAKARADALPPSTDQKLKERLSSGLNSLGGQIDNQCDPNIDTTTELTDTATVETATDTTPTETTTTATETVPTETVPTATATTPTVVPTGPNGGTPPTGPSDPGGDTGDPGAGAPQ